MNGITRVGLLHSEVDMRYGAELSNTVLRQSGNEKQKPQSPTPITMNHFIKVTESNGTVHYIRPEHIDGFSCEPRAEKTRIDTREGNSCHTLMVKETGEQILKMINELK